MIKIAGIKPPEIPPTYKPNNKYNDGIKSLKAYVIGKNTATAIVADIPGIAPKIIPTATPAKARLALNKNPEPNKASMLKNSPALIFTEV